MGGIDWEKDRRKRQVARQKPDTADTYLRSHDIEALSIRIRKLSERVDTLTAKVAQLSARKSGWAEDNQPHRRQPRRKDVRSVECPKCGAKPELQCYGYDGEFRTSNHIERVEAYEAAHPEDR